MTTTTAPTDTATATAAVTVTVTVSTSVARVSTRVARVAAAAAAAGRRGLIRQTRHALCEHHQGMRHRPYSQSRYTAVTLHHTTQRSTAQHSTAEHNTAQPNPRTPSDCIKAAQSIAEQGRVALNRPLSLLSPLFSLLSLLSSSHSPSTSTVPPPVTVASSTARGKPALRRWSVSLSGCSAPNSRLAKLSTVSRKKPSPSPSSSCFSLAVAAVTVVTVVVVSVPVGSNVCPSHPCLLLGHATSSRIPLQ